MNYPTDKNLSDCIIIHTEFILDNRLSLEARTFLLQVLSIPGIEAQPIPVISEMLCIGGCKTQRILNELREHNYYRVERLRGCNGRFIGWSKSFSDIPFNRPNARIPRTQDARRAVIEADGKTPEPNLDRQISILELF